MGTVKFKELKQKIIRSVEDTVDENASPLSGATYLAANLEDAAHAALHAIASRYWKRAVLSVNADAESVTVPDNFIDVDGVYDKKDALFIPKLAFQVGNALATTVGNGFFLYPSGTITFINKIGSLGATVFYQSHWTRPEKDNDLLDCPDFLVTALVQYSGAYLLGANAVSSASIRQYNTKVDSGQPGDIPQMKMSNFLMARYEEELKRIPMLEKGRVQ